jgi:hypothetical protein
MTACTERASIDRHFGGTISPGDERSMREHLPTCDACHAHYRRWLILSKLDPAALPAERRIARGLGLGRPSVSRIVPLGAVTLLAAAAAVLLWARVGSPPAEFTSRGATLPAPSSRVFVYDVHPGEAAALASGTIARRDELAFAYENGAAMNRVMIFGVDEHRHVYWFYPAWTREADDPVAIPIETDGRRHELPEAVRHDFDGTQLEVRSVFLDRPLDVREIEALVRAHPVGPLAIPGAVESSITFALSP